MSFFRLVFPIALSCGFGACAIHPLPENVTGVKTTAIVNRIRCEARSAVLDAQAALKQKARKAQQDGSLNRLRTLGAKLKILEDIGIVYSFSLQGSETDGFGSSANFQKRLTNGMWTYNPSLGDSLTRENVRAFTVIDNFKVLIGEGETASKKCDAEPTGPNYQYPIVGTIGIAEMIRTFVSLALHEDLDAEQQGIDDGKAAPSASANGPPAMVDTISFTTTLTAGISPMITLTPVGTALQLSSASPLNVSLMRSDIHEVIVGLALSGPLSSLGISTERSPKLKLARANRLQFGLLVSASPRTDQEAAALEAVNNQILRYEVPKSLIVTP